MNWVIKVQLFLFDFDGLLVDTERLHYQAYGKLLESYDVPFDLDFRQYCHIAHGAASGMINELHRRYPDLVAKEGGAQVLYAKKGQIYSDLIEEVGCPLMPGVQQLLETIKASGIKSAVATNSPTHHIGVLRDQHPILNTIPTWITREQYTHPKPHPECFQIAIDKLAKSGDFIVGFEDSPRGIQSLMATRAKPVLITPFEEVARKFPTVSYFPSFESIEHLD